MQPVAVMVAFLFLLSVAKLNQNGKEKYCHMYSYTLQVLYRSSSGNSKRCLHFFFFLIEHDYSTELQI